MTATNKCYNFVGFGYRAPLIGYTQTEGSRPLIGYTQTEGSRALIGYTQTEGSRPRLHTD